VKAMGAAERAEIDEADLPLVDEVDDAEGVECAESIVGDVGGFAVGGGDDFVGIAANGDAGDDVEICGVNDGESVVLLGEDEERGLGRGLGDGERKGEGSQKDEGADDSAHADTSNQRRDRETVRRGWTRSSARSDVRTHPLDGGLAAKRAGLAAKRDQWVGMHRGLRRRP